MSVFKNTLAYYYYLTSFSNMHKTIIQVAEHIQCCFNTTRNAGKRYKFITKQ